MPFFQHSVETKYLKQLNDKTVSEAYQLFKNYFHNPVIQANIREAKEEQFQEGFLRELFIKILGYTINPEPDYNLTTEKKNEKGAKKADGAILKEGKAIGVIELKGTDTTDLEKITIQAFNYKNNHTHCVYVVTSNFEKLRFYIQNAVDHIEFDLFTLTEEQFSLLWLCLSKESIYADVPKRIKEESLQEEEKITKYLYADYSVFKKELWKDLVKNNSEHDQLLLYKKSQKLLDRFLFILFSEDKGLLPPNFIIEIIKQWEKLKEMDEYRPLYERFKKYFGYLNEGWKNKEHEIFAYNGGLFQADDLLDSLKIGDDILHKHILKLSSYNFVSEVDVNILGHIFEHSLSEIETITAELEGKEVEKSKTKRKKDGIYYTPKYITKYIVENTIGKLCQEKKNELEINEEVYGNAKKRSKKRIENLEEYRNWLLQITICDPACGSGAFLNQALDFLINEHRYIDELTAKYHGSSLVLSDIENSILENNLFGVDINEESVEIAKLSLWLRTAQKGRKLTSLNKNIKCGNSLIDDPAIAGENAFNWQKEFPSVFEKGGFDVVIGNPPYVRAENIEKSQRKYFLSDDSKYKKAFGRFDLYILFNELGISLLKENGFISFIFPSSFFNQNYSTLQREWFLNELDLIEIIDLSEIDVFKGVAVETGIVTIRKGAPKEDLLISKPKNELQFLSNQKSLVNKDIFRTLPNVTYRADLNETLVNLINKIKNQTKLLDEFCYVVIGAVPHNSKTGASKDILIKERKETESCKIYLEGKNVNRYLINWDGKYLNYQPDEMHRAKFPELFENEKLLVRNISTSEGLMATLDLKHYYVNDTMSVVIPWFKLQNVNERGVIGTKEQLSFSENISLKYLLGLINSKLINFYFKLILSSNLHVYPEAIRNLPIKLASNENKKLIIERVEFILKSKASLNEILIQFANLLQSKFEIEKLSTKLQNWHELDFKAFLKELKKAKVNLSLPEEAEWMKYFNEQKQIAQQLKTDIDRTDKEVDTMVYDLYQLTPEEIKIVEKS